MSITEFASLELKHPHTLSSPPPHFISLLQRLSAEQSAHSGYPLLFFTEAEHPLPLHLISGWTDVPAHDAWIASAQNQQLLIDFADFIEIKGLMHLDINFDTLPVKDRGILCEKYRQSEVAKDNRTAKAEELVEAGWTTWARNLEPSAEDVMVRFKAFAETKTLQVLESGGKEVHVLMRFM
ncbi:hypothetical protein HWV62_41858 [Athelia sp. TMB]|nr:hypothetical protein HWV62_41858 [Athelia sp. TMB]